MPCNPFVCLYTPFRYEAANKYGKLVVVSSQAPNSCQQTFPHGGDL